MLGLYAMIKLYTAIYLLFSILSICELHLFVSGFDITIIHDADTRGGVFEHDGDKKECGIINLNSTAPRIAETINSEATKCAGGASFRHGFFQNVKKVYTNPVVITKTKLFFGSHLYSALKSKTNQTVAARHLAKYYTGPCKYDAVSVDNSEFFSGASAFGTYVTSLPESTAVIDTYIDINVNSTEFSPNQGEKVREKMSKYKVL